MNALVKMTGPHMGAASVNGKPRPAWRVAVISTQDRQPRTTVYHCLSYRRAVSLSCRMASDRKLYLHIEALPR
jgi:hypothetical protein